MAIKVGVRARVVRVCTCARVEGGDEAQGTRVQQGGYFLCGQKKAVMAVCWKADVVQRYFKCAGCEDDECALKAALATTTTLPSSRQTAGSVSRSHRSSSVPVAGGCAHVQLGLVQSR